MKPRTLITVALIGWVALGLGQQVALQAQNQDLVNLTWAAHESCRHWGWHVGTVALLVWHMLGDRLGGGQHKRD